MSSCLRLFRLIAVACFCILLLSACGSGKNSLTARRSTPQSKNVPARPKKGQYPELDGSMNEISRRLLTEAESWLGTPYLYGGNTTSGVDCSGFVLQVYLKSLNIKLPRNSAKQQEFCSKVSRNQLVEGDLVFFTSSGGNSVGHVGIYVGNGRFIHSSSSKGVIISLLSQNYYVDNFHSFGRVDAYYAMYRKGVKQEEKCPDVRDSVNLASSGGKKSPAQSSKEKTSKTTPKVQAKAETVTVGGIKGVRVTPKPSTAAAMEQYRSRALQKILSEQPDTLASK